MLYEEVKEEEISEEIKSELTKGDIIIMYILLTSLVGDKGFKVEELLTEEERERFSFVIQKNEMSSGFENMILLELFDKLLIKSGVRFGQTTTYIN